MKLYLDSADHRQWGLPPGAPPVQGVTTNPTLVHQAGLPVSLAGYLELVQRAGDHRLPELMLQLPRADAGEAADWLGRLLPAAAQARLRLTVKLPCHPDWQAVLREVQTWGVGTLLTGVANPVQLLWACAQGVDHVAPYLGRLLADGRDAWAFMGACVRAQAQGPQLLAASIKSADVLAQLMALGAAAATVRPELVASLCQDPLTQAAMAQFDADTEVSLRP